MYANQNPSPQAAPIRVQLRHASMKLTGLRGFIALQITLRILSSWRWSLNGMLLLHELDACIPALVQDVVDRFGRSVGLVAQKAAAFCRFH